MDKKRQQILINEDNLDQFLQIDLRRTFNEIQKEKYDNNFDMERQFRLERNRSRNFRIYGKILSTIIDCNNLTLEVYSDPDYNELYTTTQSSLIAFNTDNIFRRKDGKYLIELNNYPFDVAYIRIASDDFYYEDQLWEERLVFFDTNGGFVSYGTSTVDLGLDDSTVAIDNDFPFFFNKHWIRKDLTIKEEKPREISFSSTGNELLEGEILNLQISLNEPSPFGNETCILNLSSPSMNFPYYFGQVASVTLDGENATEGILFRNVGGNLAFYTAIYENDVDILSAQSLLTLQNSDYTGTYEVLSVESFVFEGFGDEPDFERYRVVLNTPFVSDNLNSDPTFSNIFTFYVGDAPDISVTLNGNSITFPYNMSWDENEQVKQLQITANSDLQVELREEFVLSFEDRFRLEEGLIPSSTFFIVDNTPKGVANFQVEAFFKNRLYFEGRRAYNSQFGFEQVNLFSSPSVLRNGALWQGINQEFYPVESLKVAIKNRGLNTVIPENPALNIGQEFVLLSGEEVVLDYNVVYNNFIPMKVKATYTGITDTSDFGNVPDGEFLVNGVPLPKEMPEGGFPALFPYYERFKSRLDGGVNDYFSEQEIEKDFNVIADDNEKSLTFTAVDGGTFVNIEVTIPDWVVEVVTPFSNTPQVPLNFSLYSNTADLQCLYDISFIKNGYRTLTVPIESLQTSEDGIQYYLNNVIGNILAPYDQGTDSAFYLNRSIYRGGSFYGLGNVIPQSEDILVEISEEEGEQGYGGTVMPLADKVYTRHVALLSDNSLPNSRTNLTTYGRFNAYGELVEAPFWSTTQVTPIPATNEEIVSQPTRKVIDIYIPQVDADDVDGTRNFDFAINGDSVFGINKVSPSTATNLEAESWWTNGEGIKVSNVDTDEFYGGFPSFQEVVDTGDEEGNFGGLVTGIVINDGETIRLTSNFAGQDFGIQNIQQFTEPEESEGIFGDFLNGATDFLTNLFQNDQGNQVGTLNFVENSSPWEFVDSPNSNTSDLFFNDEEELAIAGLQITQGQTAVLQSYIRATDVVPNLIVGDVNIGRNGLGGFSFTN